MNLTCKNPADTNIGITLLASNRGISSEPSVVIFLQSDDSTKSVNFIHFINQSNICISQCTEMSISSSFCPAVTFAKYPILFTNNRGEQLKSLVVFLTSSHTWITTSGLHFMKTKIFYFVYLICETFI